MSRPGRFSLATAFFFQKAKKLSEILFYHLTESRLGETLPALLERSLLRQWRVVVLCKTAAGCKALDSLLWDFSDVSFIPHGMENEAYAQQQPVLLGLQDKNSNQAHVCFCVEGAIAQNPQDYARLCIMFDGNNAEELAAARAAWKELKAAQKNGETLHELTYWQQTPQRKWEKQA